jgi:excinuclease UvrABC nuclease subunit
VVRGKDLTEQFEVKDIKYVFGPFPSGSLFKEALKIIRKLFQFYDTKKPVREMKTKVSRGQVDFNRQIGLYPGVQSKSEYARTIRHIKLFFEGKKGQVIKELEREMKRSAKEEKFEEAGVLKRKIFALTHIQDVALIKDDSRVYRDDRKVRIEAYDVAHLSGENMVGVMTALESGEPDKSSYRKFKIREFNSANDTGALAETLDRRLGHSEWPLPQIIVVDGSTAQKNAAERVLKQYGFTIPVVGVVKDEKHNPKRIVGSQKLVGEHQNHILLANAEAHRFAIAYHRNQRRRSSI